jgi:hypothetical protein
MQHYGVWIQVKASRPSVVGLVETLVLCLDTGEESHGRSSAMKLDALGVAVYVCELSSYILCRIVVRGWHIVRIIRCRRWLRSPSIGLRNKAIVTC